MGETMRAAWMAAAAIAVTMVIPAAAGAEGSLAPPACGPNDNATGMAGVDGQVSLADRASGRWMTSYNCNLELVGQEVGEGASWQNASYGDCDYYDTSGSSNQEHPGTRVVDVSDPAHPKTTEILHTPAMDDPWESLKVNHKRGLLAGVENGGPGFSIYDVTQNCRHPRHLSTIETTETDATGHAGAFAYDGLTYYGTTLGDVYAIDVRDPGHPKDFFRWTPPDAVQIHDVSTNEDGTRMYIGGIGRTSGADTPADSQPNNGLQIVDVSSIQRRARNPEPKLVGSVYWNDGGVSQEPFPVKIAGRPYIVYTDELGPYGIEDQEGRARACAQGLPPYGMTRLIDISDESKPKVVSKLMLQVNDPDNCASTIHDNSGEALFSYDVHYCNADDVDDAHYVACGHFQSGIRVFDVSDPANPRNVAYYIPPAATPPAGSNFNAGAGGIGEWAPSKPQFHRGNELWVSTMNNGFQVLRFTNGLRFASPSSDEELATSPTTAQATRTPAVPKRCRHTLRIRLKAPRGQRLRSAKVYLNGRRVKTVRGKRLRRPVVLRKLNRRSVEVRIVMKTRSGRTIVRVRNQKLCGRKGK
jgi:hypothetical protein